MATREVRGIQIALLLLTGVTVTLGVTAYGLFQRSETLQAEMLSHRRAAQPQQDNHLLKQIIGHAGVALINPTIENARLDDATMVSAGQPFESPPHYRDQVARLAEMVRRASAAEVMAKDSTTQVERKIVQIQSGVKDRIEIYHGKMILMGEDYLGQLKHFQDDRREFVQTTNQLAQRLDRAGAEIARWEIQHDRLKRRLYGELAALQRRYNVALDDLHRKTTVDFEALDGKVLQVSQHSRIAIINLGRDDLLRTGLVFQVYPTRGGTLQSRTAKATLEVTRILGSHRSEARILSDRDTNPVLPGDAVDSMTWQPGEPVHFALAGLLDLDGDGKSDRLKVHALIKKQGGVIDAEVDEHGERSGRVTHNTRYLVVGRRPTIGNKGEGSSNQVLAHYNRLISEARELRIQQIPLSRLTSTWKRPDQVRRLGRSQ